MTKWTAEKDALSNGLIDTGITVFHVCDLTSKEETLRLLTDIADRHNIDVDALTAERDELQRRLAAVVAKISEAVVSDDDCVCSMLCHSAIIAIAEDE